MSSAKSFSAILLSLATVQTTTASPVAARDGWPEVRSWRRSAESRWPEVIPGPGLPSLASLNLTTAQLYEMPNPLSFDDGEKHILKRLDPTCGPPDIITADFGAIIACLYYLHQLGTTPCEADAFSLPTTFCTSGDGIITGTSISGNSDSSYCGDVGLAVSWIVGHCTRPDTSIAGFAAANGNGNLIVGACSSSYVSQE